jgi:hypothetical protein
LGGVRDNMNGTFIRFVLEVSGYEQLKPTSFIKAQLPSHIALQYLLSFLESAIDILSDIFVEILKALTGINIAIGHDRFLPCPHHLLS